MRLLKLSDKEYKLSELDSKEAMADILAFAKKHLPDPIDAISTQIAKLPPRLQEIAVKEAVKAARKPRSMNDDDVQAVLATPDGIEFVMMTAFKTSGLNAEQVWQVHRQAVKELGDNYLEQLPEC
jgi:hypothetical protein